LLVSLSPIHWVRTWVRASKTALLPLIRLKNKAARTLEYDKTKATALCILNKSDLFKLLVATFRYSFDDGELPNYFENYFSEIASVYKGQTRFTSLQKCHLPRMKTFL